MFKHGGLLRVVYTVFGLLGIISIITLTVWCPFVGGSAAMGGLLANALPCVSIISDIATVGSIFGLTYKMNTINQDVRKMTHKIERLSKLWVIVSRINDNLRHMFGKSKKLYSYLADIAALWIRQDSDISRGLLGHDITEEQIDAVLGFDKDFGKMKMVPTGITGNNNDNINSINISDDDEKKTNHNNNNNNSGYGYYNYLNYRASSYQSLAIILNGNHLDQRDILTASYRQKSGNINHINDSHIRREYRNQLGNLQRRMNKIKKKFKRCKKRINALQRDEIARTEGRYLRGNNQLQYAGVRVDHDDHDDE